MKSKLWVIGLLVLAGCGRGSDPVQLYNAGIQRWKSGDRGVALYLVKKAYLTDPFVKTIRMTYETMRLDFPDKPAADRVLLGVVGVNRLAWLGVGLLFLAGVLVVIRRLKTPLPWLQRIREWDFLRHGTIILYLVGGMVLVFQLVVAVSLFSPEPAVVVQEAILGDRPEADAMRVADAPVGMEGWIVKREGSYVLFRSERGQEGWIPTNACWGVWR